MLVNTYLSSSVQIHLYNTVPYAFTIGHADAICARPLWQQITEVTTCWIKKYCILHGLGLPPADLIACPSIVWLQDVVNSCSLFSLPLNCLGNIDHIPLSLLPKGRQTFWSPLIDRCTVPFVGILCKRFRCLQAWDFCGISRGGESFICHKRIIEGGSLGKIRWPCFG